MGFFKRIFSLESLGDLTEALGTGTGPGTEEAMRHLNRKITEQQRRKNRENMVSSNRSSGRR